MFLPVVRYPQFPPAARVKIHELTGDKLHAAGITGFPGTMIMPVLKQVRIALSAFATQAMAHACPESIQPSWLATQSTKDAGEKVAFGVVCTTGSHSTQQYPCRQMTQVVGSRVRRASRVLHAAGEQILHCSI